MSKDLPAWHSGLTRKDWLFDGSPINTKYRLEIWDDLDWSKAWCDMGPSPGGNPGPYWHVPRKNGDTTHRLYPKLLQSKWLLVVQQAIAECVRNVESTSKAAIPERNQG